LLRRHRRVIKDQIGKKSKSRQPAESQLDELCDFYFRSSHNVHKKSRFPKKKSKFAPVCNSFFVPCLAFAF